MKDMTGAHTAAAVFTDWWCAATTQTGQSSWTWPSSWWWRLAP